MGPFSSKVLGTFDGDYSFMYQDPSGGASEHLSEAHTRWKIQPWNPNLRTSEAPRTQQSPQKQLWVSECAQSCLWLTISHGSYEYQRCSGHLGPSLGKQRLKEGKFQTPNSMVLDKGPVLRYRPQNSFTIYIKAEPKIRFSKS